MFVHFSKQLESGGLWCETLIELSAPPKHALCYKKEGRILIMGAHNTGKIYCEGGGGGIYHYFGPFTIILGPGANS